MYHSRSVRSLRHHARPPAEAGRLFLLLLHRVSGLYLFCPDGPDLYSSATAIVGRIRPAREGRTLADALALVAGDLRVEESPVEGAEEAGRLLWTVATMASTVSLSLPGDHAVGEVSLTWIDRRERCRGVSREDALAALRDAAGEAQPSKKCPRCRSIKELVLFPRDRRRRHGRFPWCSACNRANVQYYSRLRRLQAVPAQQLT